MSQKQLAELVQRARARYAKIERQRRDPRYR